MDGWRVGPPTRQSVSQTEQRPKTNERTKSAHHQLFACGGGGGGRRIICLHSHGERERERERETKREEMEE